MKPNYLTLKVANTRTVPKASHLHYAVANGHIDVIHQLLPHRVDVNSLDGNLDTPLHWAAAAGKIDIIRLLIGYNARLEMRNVRGMTPFLCAKEKGQREAMKFLESYGADRS